MSFKLKNYTSTVPWRKTIAEIELLLLEFGANKILKEHFGDGRVKCLQFQIGDKVYQLPANSDGVFSYLNGTPNRKHYSEKKNDQAERTSWRLIKDWIHAQLSMVKTEQAKPDQIMLPYLWDGEKTLYQAIEDGQVKLPTTNLLPITNDLVVEKPKLEHK